MSWLTDVEWAPVFELEMPLPEIFVRGTLTYLAIFALLRVVLKRESSGLGMTDILVIVLIADAAQNAMADDYGSVPEGILLVAVIVMWAWLLDWLSFRFPRLESIVKPPKLKLVADGRPLWRNMARELVTMEELNTALREQGIGDVSEVSVAFMEHDGRISAIAAGSDRA